MKKTYELVELSDTEWQVLLEENQCKQRELRNIQLQRICNKLDKVIALLTFGGKNL